MTMEYKAVPVNGVRVIDEDEGIVETIVSVTGLVDRVNDVIEPGAYAKSLAVRKPKGVWHHQWDKPISKTLDVKELQPGDRALPKARRDGTPWPREAGAVKVVTQFNLNTTRGKDAFEDVKFFGDEQEWCVDEDTHILTQRGWLRYDELTTDDHAYSLDMATGAARFTPVLGVNVFPSRARWLRKIKTGGFDALSTSAHRWPVRFDDGRTGWRTTSHLVTSNAIFRSAPRSDAPLDAKWSDAFVELIGWYWTEGWSERSNLCIGQSQAENPVNVDRIRNSLARAFPEGGWSERCDDHGIVTFRLGVEIASGLFAVCGHSKEPKSGFLLALTDSQLRLLVSACMAGDGHHGVAGQKTWYQVSAEGVAAFQALCTLAGIPTAAHQPLDYGNRYGRVPQNVARRRGQRTGSRLRTSVRTGSVRQFPVAASSGRRGPGSAASTNTSSSSLRPMA